MLVPQTSHMGFYRFTEIMNSPEVLLKYAGKQNILYSILVWKVVGKVPPNCTREKYLDEQNKPELSKSTNKILLGVAASS